MRAIGDQVLARRMLVIRGEGGYRFGTFLRMNTRRYVVLLAFCGAALIFFAFVGIWFGFALVMGLVMGAIARDYGWVRASRRSWPFTLRVIDWDLVEELAADKWPA
jgi:hypothetical protein